MNRFVTTLSFALVILAAATPLFAQSVPLERWIVPVVGSTAGANGAQFRTSMQLHNPGDEAAAGSIVFHPAGIEGTASDPQLRYALAPYETVSFDDIVASLGQGGLGSLDIVADAGTLLPTVTARAFNLLPNLGTLGSSVPVLHPDDALARGDVVGLISPANMQRYRLNIGIRTLEGPVTLKITIYGSDGNKRGETLDRTYPAEYFEQVSANILLGAPLLPNESVTFEIVSGRAFIYGSTTDNRTNDPNIQIDRLFGRSISADDQSVTTPEDTPVTITLTGELQGSITPVFTITRAPQHGMLGAILAGDDTADIVYTPDANYNGPDDFEFEISDGHNRSARGTVTINVTPVNDPPVATAVVVTTDEDQSVVITLTGSDPDGDALTFAIASAPVSGTLDSIVPVDGTSATITYTPNPDYNGNDGFTFTVNDGTESSNAATVTIDVLPVNDVPLSAGDLFAGVEDTLLTIAPAGVLANDTDGDGDTLTAVLVTPPATGTLTLNADGSFSYTPAANASGTMSFTYHATDGTSSSPDALVTINVTPVNDAPSFAKGADVTVLEDAGAQSLAGWATALSAGPADESAQTLAFAVTNNSNPTLFSAPPAIAADGTLSFTTAPNANGTATITLQLADNGGTANGGVDTSAPQTFVITVTAVNDAPSFTKGGDATVLEDSGAQTLDPWATALSAGPADENTQTLAFSVTGNSNPALFAAGPAISATGALTFTPAADASGSATITIVIADNGGTANGGADTSATQTFVINVTEVNDAPSFAKGADATVLEDAGAQTLNPWATAISPGPAAESGQTVAFNVVSNTNPALFSAQPSISPAGVLTFTPAPDAYGTATITINAQDNGGTANGGVDTSATQSFVVNVTPVNDAPTATITPLHAVDEDSGPHSVANYVTAISPGPANESGQTVSFSITGNTNPALFASGPAIDPAGTLTYSLNPDAFGTAVITVQLMDDGGTANGGIDTATLNFTIDVAAVNDAPVVTTGGPFTLAENSANGTSFGATIAATDVDPGQTLSFTITAGNTGGAFAINAATGEITVANSAALDFETTPSFTLTIAATDDGAPPLSGNQTFTINLTDVNEAPVVTVATFGVDENTPNGSSVGTVTATDPDAGQTLVFAITAGNSGGAFAINAATGAITVANSAALDYETTPTFSLTVQVTDNGLPALFGTATITVNVNNVNEAPVVTPATLTLPENSLLATFVGNVVATDADAGQTLTYAITAGNTAGAFAIDASTATITVANAAAIDYETNPTFALTITVTDNGTPNLSGSALVTINLTDQNETPTASDATFTVDENSAAATAVGTVTATDPDSNPLTYLISAGNTGGAFAINLTTGAITVANTAALDFETNPTFTLTIDVSDGIFTVQPTITINLNDVNEAPSFASPGTASIAENTTAVMTVTATDPEAQAITYSITGGVDAALFSINPATGALTFNAPPDFEAPADAGANNVYDVQVQATDGTNPVTQNISVTVTNTNEPPAFTSLPTASVPENTTAVQTVTTTDAEGDTVTYSITGGADAALFSINATTGALAFNAAPDFEAPADAGADNIYLVEVTATDGTTPVAQVITVSVTGVNENPTIAPQTFGVADDAANGTFVGNALASDPDLPAQTLSYLITAGNTGGAFGINASTGAITVATSAAVNFEVTPTFSLTVQVTDDGTGSLTASNTITINVSDVNETPVVNDQSFSVDENSPNATAVGTVVATDADTGQTLSYSITGGNTGGAFAINAVTGAITVANSAALDFETTTSFPLTVQVTDNGAPVLSDTATITITINNVNEAPSFTSSATPSVPENTTAVTTVTTTDPEGNTVTYSISGGVDAALFSINPSTGALTFNAAPNYEAPADADSNNTYLVQVTATDGTTPVVQNITVTLTNANEAPAITSPATASVSENTTAVITVTTTDPEGDTITYAISGGADQALFSINAATGALAFVSAPNFEAAADSDTNNIYLLQVTATDGTNPAIQNLTVTVTDVNEVPSFTSPATPSVAENTTAVVTVAATDPEGVAPTYSITGGADMALFTINGVTGALSFLAAPNFEAPTDAGANNVYDVTVTASDGTNNPTQAISVTVTDVNDPPSFTSSATPSAPENTTGVITVTTNDPEANTITYSITGGADAALFTINSSSGALSFLAAPNFESPGDTGANNIYDVIVTASDGTNAPTQAIAVTVTNVNEAPVITSPGTASVPENSTAVLTVTAVDPDAGASITYSITGGADVALFTINGATGALSFLAGPNFEVPTDAGSNNVYDVIVTASDGTNAPTQAIAVTVTNVNEGPSFTSPNAVSYAENGVGSVITVTTSDPETDTVTYAITGGTDTGDLSINPTTGVVTFNASPNYEAAADSDTNNTYVVEITATDGTTPITQTLTVTVTNVNEAPSITGGTGALNVNENPVGTITTVTATDPDGTTPTFAIVGGADAADFTINATTGALSFAATPNFEAPADADTNNIYLLTVRATDGSLFADATITVTVVNVNEAPTAVIDAYTALGNTTLHIAGTIVVPATTVAKTGDVNASPRTTGIKFNDTDPDTIPAFNTLTITFVTGNAGAVAVPGTTTTTNGSVTLQADGSFLYTPNPGFTGADSFQYTINDGATSVTGTVNLTVVGPVVWYVKNNAPSAGNGTSAAPSQTLAAAITASLAGHTIYVMEGDGTATNYGGTNAMKADQRLWGQGITLDVTATNGVVLSNLILATNRPLIGPGVGPALGTVTLGNGITGVEVRGLRINGGTLNAVDVTTTGVGSAGLIFSNNIVTAAALEGVDVNAGGTGTVTIGVNDNTFTSTGNSLDITRTAGSVIIRTFDDNIVSGTTGGAGIVVTGPVLFDADTVTAGIQTVPGGLTVIGASGAGNGVGGSGVVLSNVSGDVSFTNLSIFADNGTGLQITGTGAWTGAAGTRITVGAGVGVIEATGGPAVDVNSATVDLQLSSIRSTNTTTRGVSLVSVSDGVTPARFSAGAGSTITSTGAATGPLFNVSGGNAGISYAGTISNTGTGRAVLVDSWSGDDATDDMTFSGLIDENSAGILLNANSGSRMITFSGGLDIDTTTGEGFGATSNTNALGLNVTGTTNDITSTAATALRVTNTTIGASNLNFRNISSGNTTAAADPASGIILSSTGTSGRLIVAGNGGGCSTAANCTGGAIQNTTSHGISMASTLNPSFTRMFIQNTAGSGIDGTGVNGFTLDSSVLDNNGTGGGSDESNVAFDVSAAGTESNVSGVVTITNNTLTNARYHGVRILNFNGTMTDAVITGNTITSSTAVASSLGSGIHIQALGSAATAANLTKATISSNVISNFPSGSGVHIAGGNSNASGPGGTIGTPGDATNIINITSNTISGQNAANPMGTSAILAVVSGGNSGSRSQGNFNISNNGTNPSPLRNTAGITIGAGTNGNATGTFTTNNNFISANNIFGSGGISGGAGIVVGGTESPDMTWTITNNSVKKTDGNGILAVNRGALGILKVKIQNNTVDAPLAGVRPGIRVDAGNAAVGSDSDVCLNISGNTSAGSGGHPGIGLRKQGTSTTVHAFGINGMAATASPGVEAYVDGLNPAGGGTLLISATSGFSNCSLP